MKVPEDIEEKVQRIQKEFDNIDWEAEGLHYTEAQMPFFTGAFAGIIIAEEMFNKKQADKEEDDYKRSTHP